MHGKNSGEVGDVGEHGDLGSNAVGWAPSVPSESDLDADAAEKAAAAATSTAPPVAVEKTREEKVSGIRDSLIAAGTAPDIAATMAESAVKSIEDAAAANAAKQEGSDAT